jgi:hypothetical protein
MAFKLVSRENSKAFAQKPVQITTSFEHRMTLSNHLAENLPFIRNITANFLLYAEMDCRNRATSAFCLERNPLETANHREAAVIINECS